jgi:hypothetical protein
MALVFATPYSPIAPPRTWIGLQMTWTGWDGSLWNLTSAAEGAVMMPGVRGMTMPPVVHYSTAYASVAGAAWRGHTVDAREVFWPIQLFHDLGSQGWIDRDRAFWRTMRPEKTGTWTVTHPSGAKRHLDCRFSNDGDATYNHDPVLSGWSNYGITLTAEHPFWRAAPIKREWSAGGALPFYPESTGDTYIISPSTTLDSSAMPNPGDVDAFPVWEVHGPTTTAQVGVAGRNITIPFGIDAGQVLVIDTAPTVQAATLYDVVSGVRTNPVDKTPDLGIANFVPVPADSVTTTSLLLSGAGKVSLILTPLYLRAW